MKHLRIFALVAFVALPTHILAEDVALDVRQVTTHVGEMTGTFNVEDIEERLRFEPFQLLNDIFNRDDVVYLMRHGPTDWSRLDVRDVAPTDCENQRIMTSEGERQMRDLASILAANAVVPSQIIASEWCRNQQTLAALQAGYDRVDPQLLQGVDVITDPDVNLLLSLQGARSTTELEETITTWDGHATREGPLLIISHFTNIEELTQFSVFEGEILVLDPDRKNQVIGTIRLRSAAPDVGHFAETLSSPLLAEDQALDMVSRYYAAIAEGDDDLFRSVLSDQWVDNAESGSLSDQDVRGFLSELTQYQSALSDLEFDIENIYATGETVTVIGRVRATHTGEIFGLDGSGRFVDFGVIAVHRIEDGLIAESWQLADQAALIDQITSSD